MIHQCSLLTFIIISISCSRTSYASLPYAPLPPDDLTVNHAIVEDYPPPPSPSYTSRYPPPEYPVHRTTSYPPPPPPKPYQKPECALIVPASRPPPPARYPRLPPSDAGLNYISNYIPHRSKRSYRREPVPLYPVEGNVCITYEDISQAVLDAKAKFGGFVPPEVYELSSDFPKSVHVAVPAEIIEEATRILSYRFGLNREAVLYLIPRVDTTRTAARDICPTFLLPVKCEVSKYRTLTGMCNNLNYPSWGAARTSMIRLLPPDYSDGIGVPRRSVDGSPLPSARRVSFILHQDISKSDAHISYLAVAFGQIVDHDLTFAPITRGPFANELECCGKDEHDRHPACLPIEVPKDDPFFKFFQRTCMEFTRVQPGLKHTCPLGPRNPANTISSYLDGNYIYGSTQEVANRLREKKGGRLKSTTLYKHLGLKDLLPLNTHDPDHGCERHGRPKNAFCFDAGDERVNEQLPLTVTHTLLMREHNRIADYLYQENPSWNDERLYQESRRIMVAELQHIIFNEWLPIILGRKIMSAYGLDLDQSGYYNGYDEKVNPSIRLAFQAAAFRFGHSILPDVIERYNKYHQKIEAIRLSVLLRQPYELYKPGAVDSFLLGLLNQEAARMDAEVTTEVTNHLFERPGAHFGRDLAAINVQRGRETGLPGYNAFREYCGLNRVKYWSELAGSFDNKTIYRMQKLYQSVDDIDLWSAGIAEYPLPGALLGPVFSCIIAEQFANLRRGDRFWYENYGQFTPEQLYELRKVKMAALVCDNADDIDNVQLFPFLTADPHNNPRVPCQSIPKMDLSKFSDISYGTNNAGYVANALGKAAAAAASSS